MHCTLVKGWGCVCTETCNSCGTRQVRTYEWFVGSDNEKKEFRFWRNDGLNSDPADNLGGRLYVKELTKPSMLLLTELLAFTETCTNSRFLTDADRPPHWDRRSCRLQMICHRLVFEHASGLSRTHDVEFTLYVTRSKKPYAQCVLSTGRCYGVLFSSLFCFSLLDCSYLIFQFHNGVLSSRIFI
jgi:hypothetical protein